MRDKPTLSGSHEPGDIFDIGTTTVTYTTSDRSGNSNSCSFTVEVTASESSSSSSASLSDTGTATGIGVGVGVLVLILIVVVVLLRRARANEMRPQDFNVIFEMLNGLSVDDETGPRKPREIKREHIKIFETLGKGNFGEVSKGVLTEHRGAPGYLVAIKVLRASLGADRTSLLQEAAVMAQFECERVVGLVGVVTVGAPLMVVIEYCEHGSLDRYLRTQALSEGDRLLIAGDCAEGLTYLASRRFVHRDIAARNVLVSSERRAKISDFGLSRETSGKSDYYRSKGGQIPVRWTAPEALEEHKFSSASDCWSFGVLVYEIWTKGELPYKDMTNERLHVAVQAGYRLVRPDDCSPEIYEIMLHCWHADPNCRPAMSSLVERLRTYHTTGTVAPSGYDSRLTPPVDNVDEHEYLDYNKETRKFIKPPSGPQSRRSTALSASLAALPQQTSGSHLLLPIVSSQSQLAEATSLHSQDDDIGLLEGIDAEVIRVPMRQSRLESVVNVAYA